MQIKLPRNKTNRRVIRIPRDRISRNSSQVGTRTDSRTADGIVPLQRKKKLCTNFRTSPVAIDRGYEAVCRCAAYGKTGNRCLVAVVGQRYAVNVMDEHVLRGNAAIIKCHIPSFVAEFVEVDSWIEDETTEIYPSADYGTHTPTCATRSTCANKWSKFFHSFFCWFIPLFLSFLSPRCDRVGRDAFPFPRLKRIGNAARLLASIHAPFGPRPPGKRARDRSHS